MTFFYDIVPPEIVHRWAENISGIRPQQTKSGKFFSLTWRLILGVFLIFYFITGITPFGAIDAFTKEQRLINLYPSSCSGAWQNPQNSEGQPLVSAGGDINFFSEDNSAVYKTGLADLFCRGFGQPKPTTEIKPESQPLEDASPEEKPAVQPGQQEQEPVS